MTAPAEQPGIFPVLPMFSHESAAICPCGDLMVVVQTRVVDGRHPIPGMSTDSIATMIRGCNTCGTRLTIQTQGRSA